VNHNSFRGIRGESRGGRSANDGYGLSHRSNLDELQIQACLLSLGKGDADGDWREGGNFRGYLVLPGIEIDPPSMAILIAYRVSNRNSRGTHKRQPNARYRTTFRIEGVY
jgi:hypothetical protein